MRRAVASINFSVFAVLLAPAPGRADIIAQASPGGGTADVVVNNPEGVFWTQTGRYTGVSISAYLSSADVLDPSRPDGAGTVYLTNAIGPGTTSAKQIAQATVSGLTLDPAAPIDLFTGLTLGPGTYFLTISGGDPGGLGWESFSPITDTTAAGGSLGGELAFSLPSYPPAASFIDSTATFAFSVTGTPTPVPEPSSALFLLTIALACHPLRSSSAHKRR